MNYQEALTYLQDLTKFGFNFGLGRIEELLNRLGNPHKKLKVVHVGGTNGKGSTTAFISGILQAAGYRVGVFTSPHLHSYTERYTINNVTISEEAMARYIVFLKPYLDKMVEDGYEHPTEFEVCTALAFQYFYDQKVDYVVLEVGLGGAIDSTNVVVPLVSVITNVAMDHMDYLGHSIREIAEVKAGIIKLNGLAVTAVQDPEALEVISRTARERNARLIEVYKEAKWEITDSSVWGQTFNLNTSNRTYKNVRIGLLGHHQIVNAVTAIVTVEALETLGVQIGQDAVENGMASVKWPARLEIMQRQPMVIIDGAHNVHGAKSLRNALQEVFSYDKLILVFGMLGDKEREKVVAELAPLAAKVVITRPNSPRAGQWDKVAEEVKKYVNDVRVIEDIHQAVDTAVKIAEPGDLVCITGSLYMVAEAREYFMENKF
ncbi:bifunctional folylpolyglutamate synthase/ dihydrofolate synthase [Thermincola ferriacetica]|uniref:Dihydrofolate synthase/folylpolyglutamate synthase n=1 Tax=Thermincola ferriacetica TaxID=281456 RepID=A0A0L6W285_9FIRM|nr:folylpolyglutamate synthase/dihydrofolate synthase family protein [Thermincola ferriacetica]KNZ69576.1 bifunctional folylpolyglutamate synthase/ dihydrofolate synthase [Thermincola ferriacetica]